MTKFVTLCSRCDNSSYESPVGFKFKCLAKVKDARKVSSGEKNTCTKFQGQMGEIVRIPIPLDRVKNLKRGESK